MFLEMGDAQGVSTKKEAEARGPLILIKDADIKPLHNRGKISLPVEKVAATYFLPYAVSISR